MQHLKDVGMSYVEHLLRAWKIAGILIIHGIYPDIWKTKASDLLCDTKHSPTYKNLMKHYGVNIEK